MTNETTGARVTPERIAEVIVDTRYDFLPGTTITVCTLTLKNGTKVCGINYGSIDPLRQDWDFAKSDAYKAAREKVWELEGYALRERLEAGDVGDKVVAIARQFIDRHEVSCPEAASDDDVYARAPELVADLAEVVGYHQYSDVDPAA